MEIFIENNSVNDKMRYGKTNLLLFVLVYYRFLWVIFSYGIGNASAASGNTIYVNGSSGHNSNSGHTGKPQN